MRKFLQRLLKKPIVFLAEKLSSAPIEKEVFASLSDLLASIAEGDLDSGPVISFDYKRDRFIVFSDQHKGIRDAVDDFRKAEENYLAALAYYDEQKYQFISLGDCEELWKNTPQAVMKNNDRCFQAEKQFLDKERYVRIFGNHDLVWKFVWQQNFYLKPVFGKKLRVYEGLLLQTKFDNKKYSLFLSHGHQGDKRNDGNSFTIWFVANIWTPIQRYLQISVNTPATSFELTDRHNIMMYDWSARQERLIYISGHTHKPVFASLDHIEQLTKRLQAATQRGDTETMALLHSELEKRKVEYAGKQALKTIAKPSYFNSGCCCFDDGDITGIEIADGFIRLIKWDNKEGPSQRMVLEEASLETILTDL